MIDIDFEWCGTFTSTEANALHAAAFNARLYSDEEWNWVELVRRHSLGWCTARSGRDLIGFTNVIWDGLVHAWIQDVMVAPEHQKAGIGRRLVEMAAAHARDAGCEWLHADFDDDVADFYYRTCGFERTNGGLLYLA